MLRTILTPFDGGDAADAMLHLACQAVGDDGLVVVLYITRVSRRQPPDTPNLSVDAAYSGALDRVRRLTHDYDCAIDVRLRTARRWADAIVDEAAASGADAVFLALPRGPFWRRALHAALAWDVVRRAPCRVLLGSMSLETRALFEETTHRPRATVALDDARLAPQPVGG